MIQVDGDSSTREGDMTEKVYKFAIGLSIIFVADGLFMAWARRQVRPYAATLHYEV
jgi:hypothetical protein